MLTLFLALASLGPIPRVCPWAETTSERLLPNYQLVIPRNASIWVREYGHPTDPITFSPTVEADLIATDLSASGGRLLELRPRELLPPTTNYRYIGTTSTTTDDTPPATPVIRARGAITSPAAACSTAGIFLEFEESSDAVFYAIEGADDGSLIELGRRSEMNLVPTEPFATLRFQVVAIDVAGNRSPPTKVIEERAAGISPEPVYSFNDDDGGCSCVSNGPINQSFALALAFTWVRALRPERRRTRRA
jgi:hypothetical protein